MGQHVKNETGEETSYLSFFLHKRTFGLNFSPHKSVEIVAKLILRQNSVNHKKKHRFSSKEGINCDKIQKFEMSPRDKCGEI